MSKAPSIDIDRTQRRLGPIWLTQGVTPGNVLALFYAGMMTMVFVTGIGVLNPYLLNVHMEMDPSVQGNFMGNLTVIAEIAVLGVVIAAGTMSDRIGRRTLYVTGFVLVSIVMIILPILRSPEAMITWRVVLSVGLNMCLMMLASTIADYPQNPSRGKLIGINGVITGLGVILIAAITFGQLPSFFAARGAEPVEAGNYTFWLLAAVALVSALVTFFGLRGGRTAAANQSEPYLKLLRTGMNEVRGNARLILTGFAYFVSRGDLFVLVAFMTLWLVNAGIAQGMAPEEAQSAASRLFALSQTAMILFIPVMGWIIDKVDRVTALAISMAIATVGYLALGVVGDPFSSWLIYPVVILAGAGEAAVVVSAPALVGQEAPLKVRGSIVGLMGFFGTVGVLISGKVSGEIFDLISNQAPFTYMAILNAFVCVAAIWVRMHFGASRGIGAKEHAESMASAKAEPALASSKPKSVAPEAPPAE